MALALDFEVICCDPREEYNLTWDVPGTTFSKAMPDDLVIELQLDPHSAVVAVTHDPKLDDLVLLEALKSPAFYIGALGSRGNTAKRARAARAVRPVAARRSTACTGRSVSTSAARRRPRSRCRSSPRSSR